MDILRAHTVSDSQVTLLCHSKRPEIQYGCHAVRLNVVDVHRVFENGAKGRKVVESDEQDEIPRFTLMWASCDVRVCLTQEKNHGRGDAQFRRSLCEASL